MFILLIVLNMWSSAKPMFDIQPVMGNNCLHNCGVDNNFFSHRRESRWFTVYKLICWQKKKLSIYFKITVIYKSCSILQEDMDNYSVLISSLCKMEWDIIIISSWNLYFHSKICEKKVFLKSNLFNGMTLSSLLSVDWCADVCPYCADVCLLMLWCLPILMFWCLPIINALMSAHH